MKKLSMFILGVLSGCIVGSALAILMAPDSGENIRNRISGYSHSIQEDVRHAALARRQELEQELNRLRKIRLT